MGGGKIAIISAILLLVGCAKEPATPKEPVNLDPHHITQEQALRTMTTAIGQLYGGTRAPRNYSIETLKGRDLRPTGTRSGDETPLPEDVLYIVNFENDEGFAVLAADDRLPEIFAITEGGHLQVTDFEPITEADTLEIMEPGRVIGSMIAQNIRDLALDPLLEDFKYWWDDPDAPQSKKIGPLTTTHWHQREPFNTMCPIRYDTSYYMAVQYITPSQAIAGCVPIAMAQLIAYNEKPALSVYGINGVTWTQIRNTNYTKPKTSSNQAYYNAIASVIRQIGDGVDIEYFYNFVASGVHNYDTIPAYFRNIAKYSTVEEMNFYSTSTIIAELNSRRPVLILGKGDPGSCHLWVIDGYIGQLDPHNGKYTRNLMVHCNWGWAGECNGYYSSHGVFDVTNGATQRESGIDTVTGTGGKALRYYDFITYRLIP